MSKLGLSLKISIPKKSKNVSKPSIKIEAKNKKGRVILEDEEYKKLLNILKTYDEKEDYIEGYHF